jgi:AcrR family transcriptional regulator
MSKAARRRREQRDRLLAAMVTTVAEKGYQDTRVADVLAATGIARSGFYRHFDSKQDCFLAALDTIAEIAGAGVYGAYETAEGPLEQRLAAPLGALAEMVAEHPAAARVGWVEVYAAGAEALSHLERMTNRVETTVQAELDEFPQWADMPRELLRALLGGGNKLVHTRVREGRGEALRTLMPELLEWALSYRTPPRPLQRPGRPPAGLVPEPRPPAEARERILLAVTEIVAEHGYRSLVVTEIARRAGVSLSTFYGSFESKEHAFVAAIDHAQRRIYFAVEPVFAAVESWERAVATGLHAFLAFLASEPATARLAAVGSYEGGADGLAKRDEAIVAAYRFLDAGYELHPETPEVASEAIGASIYALLSEQVELHGAQSAYAIAPTAIYVALAPFVGSERACELANAPVAVPLERASA